MSLINPGQYLDKIPITYHTPNVFPFEMPPSPTPLNNAQAYSNNGSTYVITYVMNN